MRVLLPTDLYVDPKLRQREGETKKIGKLQISLPTEKKRKKIFANDDNGDDYDANLLRKKSKRDAAGKDFPRARKRARESERRERELRYRRRRPSVVST